jgi:hypothetical protein
MSGDPYFALDGIFNANGSVPSNATGAVIESTNDCNGWFSVFSVSVSLFFILFAVMSGVAALLVCCMCSMAVRSHSVRVAALKWLHEHDPSNACQQSIRPAHLHLSTHSKSEPLHRIELESGLGDPSDDEEVGQDDTLGMCHMYSDDETDQGMGDTRTHAVQPHVSPPHTVEFAECVQGVFRATPTNTLPTRTPPPKSPPPLQPNDTPSAPIYTI